MAHSEAFRQQRRKLILAGVAAGGLGTTAWLRPPAIRDGHSDYFRALSRALDASGLATPTLVIDQQRLDHNIQVLLQHLGHDFDYRIVVKSLPSVPLLEHVMAKTGTRRLMLFHQPFLNQIASSIPDADILLGKPLPVAAAARFYDRHQADQNDFQPRQQLQWLIDSPRRLAQYEQLARQRSEPMRVNLELDIGLHRGGFNDDQLLSRALLDIEQSRWLSFSGFMGYEPHIVKAPGPTDWLWQKAMARYNRYVSLARNTLGRDLAGLTFNTGGSTTYQLYKGRANTITANELAAGSGLVMPTDFDLTTLAGHQPAAFIATPVLKLQEANRIPGTPGIGRLQRLWNPNRARAVFIYGGNWKARPVSPAGLTTNPVFGRSSNQEMLNLAAGVPLQEDDWVFLRPHQSESVFLQFGDLAVFDARLGEISRYWPVVPEG